MIRFHSTISKSRFAKENGKCSSSLKVTLVCLKCDLMDSSGGNRMCKHLSKRPNHGCKVIQVKDINGKDQVVPVAENLKSKTTEIVEHLEEILSTTSVQNQHFLNSRKAAWSYNEQRLINLRQEQLRHEAAVRVDKDRQLQASLRDEEVFERRRNLQQVRQEHNQKQMENAILKAKGDKINRQMQIEQEERIAKELSRINCEKQREEKIRQHIKENSTELRELESKLRFAYMNKERAAQIAEQEALKFDSMRSEADFARKMQMEEELASLEEKKLQQRRHEEAIRYQQELDDQLMERQNKKQEAYDEFLKEKLMVDEIIRKIYEEDQMERRLKLEKVKATKEPH
uniref:Meiosis-specific nuclear structural protein 1 n=1 Tax=Knipowitschia caucasica TaxID=637954 RepID=A0AAV2LP35_KNICA